MSSRTQHNNTAPPNISQLVSKPPLLLIIVWAMNHPTRSHHRSPTPEEPQNPETSNEDDDGKNPHHPHLLSPPDQGTAHVPCDYQERARCEWDFSLSTVVSSSADTVSSDTLGVIEFDPSGSLIATGGIARKIRVYGSNKLLPHESSGGESDTTTMTTLYLDHSSAYSYCIGTPAKLSSLRWRPESGGRVMGSGDYDGVITEYDLERRVPVFERDEHGGRRVWSIDYSHFEPIGASGSDDGTMQVWDPRCDGGRCLSVVQPSAGRSSVCCVEFSPFDRSVLAIGCANRKAYAYDLRNMASPVRTLDGHSKTVTYTKFLDRHTVVSASIDGCLKMWCVEEERAVRTYRGHVNSRSFVGLSVWRDGGLLGCGSESNQVFVYDRRWGDPIWIHGFELRDRGRCEGGFVSSVCWKQAGQDRCTLVAGDSDGALQVLVGKRKSS